LKQGGTGSISEIAEQPTTVPDKYESGSHNMPGIAGLLAAAEWILGETVETLRRHELRLCETFLDALRAVRGVEVHGLSQPGEVERRVGVFSVGIGGFEPRRLAAELEGRFGILTLCPYPR
jgi:selenocysteine lyase/cysteine desulfurase